MNRRLMGVLVFALVVSAGASFLLYRVVSSKLEASARPAQARLLVAARNLEIGTLIKEIDLRQVDWPGTVPAQALNKPEDIVGRGVLAAIYQGEPILESRLAPKGAGAGLAATIPVGMRAVAIRINEIIGVSGFVVPGMRVDLLILGTPPNAPQNMGTATKTLLQNIEVLSAGQQIQKDAEGKPVSVPVVNLLVTPEQAEVISLATNASSIQLVLRNPLDTQEAKTPGTAMAKLWSGQAGPLFGPDTKPAPPKPRVVRSPQAPPPPRIEKPAAPPPPIVVEVIHGAAKTETKFKAESEGK